MSTGNRRYIHPAQKELIVSMSAHMSSAEIARVTHISQRTVTRVVALWRQTGKVERKPEVSGRPCELDSDDVAYLVGMVQRTPAIELSKLQGALLSVRGSVVDESTVARALNRNGYTNKRAIQDAVEE